MNRQQNNLNQNKSYDNNSARLQKNVKSVGQPQSRSSTSQNIRKISADNGDNTMKRPAANTKRHPNPTQNKNVSVQRGAAGTQSKRASGGVEILGKKPLKHQKKKVLKTDDNKPRTSSRTARKPTSQQPAKSHQQSFQPAHRNNSEVKVSRKAGAAARKAMNTKHTGTQRRKFKGGNYVLYYLLFGLVAVVVLVVLSNTVLFNCKTIVVEGAQRYTADEIIEVSKVRKGDNLLHIDKTAAQDKIVAGLAYIDSAEVKKSFPTKVIITVEEAEGWFCVSQNGVNMLISRGGKILEKGAYTDVPVVTGYNAKSLKTGGKLQSDTEAKQDIPQTILNTAEKVGLENINSIDVTDRYSIVVEVDRRITLELGGITNIESKIIVAKNLIENEISPSESVTLLLTNPEKVAAHTNTIQEQDDAVVQPSPEDSSDVNPDNSAASE